MVVQVSRHYLPRMGFGFDDAQVNVHIADENEFIGLHPDEYDVIIVDFSDPVSLGKLLFEGPFYENCRGTLKKTAPWNFLCCRNLQNN